VRDAESQARVREILERELGHAVAAPGGPREPGDPPCRDSRGGVRHAPVPRFPGRQKELFPIVDDSGRAKPAIFALVEDLLASGIEDVGIVVQPRDRGLFEEIFYSPPPPDSFKRLSASDQEYCRHMSDVGRHVSFIAQDTAGGFGHAVYCAREWVGDRAFLLALGDHLFSSRTQVPCARQLLTSSNATKAASWASRSSHRRRFDGGLRGGLLEVAGHPARHHALRGEASADLARERLVVEGLGVDSYLGLFGQYVLTPRVFDLLAERIDGGSASSSELDLTATLDDLRREEGFVGYVVEGESYDIGMPEKYRNALGSFGRRRAADEPAREVSAVVGGGCV